MGIAARLAAAAADLGHVFTVLADGFATLATGFAGFRGLEFVRRATLVPVGTVTMTVYYHADSAQLQASGTSYLLAQARAQVFRNGYFDHTAQLWNEAGVLLATTHQVVYYKN